MANAAEIYEEVKALPLQEQIKIASLILDQVKNHHASTPDYSDEWSDEDIQDMSAFAAQYANEQDFPKTVAEKLQLMEELWKELRTQPEELPVPEWHKILLDAREERVQQGQAQFYDLEESKKRVWERIRDEIPAP